MGKVILYIGLAILVLGVGPLLIVCLLDVIGLGNPDSNGLGVGLLAYVSLWPGIILTSVGSFFCFCKFLLDKLPYK